MRSPPKRLFVRGELPGFPDQKYLCVVGSRRWTEYGKDAINQIIGGLKGYPISIVSGLAVGIDSIAHRAALEAGLHCVAFPGSSLEWGSIYPQSHLELAESIVGSGGALVSEWQTGYPTGKWAFPARNRLMAGISHAVLIVEAAQKSGSLMTAKHAEEFNRDILAVPGPIDSPRSYGPHMLIRNGAALVSSPYDVLEALGFDVARPTDPEGRRPQQKRMVPDYLLEDNLAREIIQTLERGPASLDFMISAIKAPAHSLNEKLSLLELEGIIRIEGARVTRI